MVSTALHPGEESCVVIGPGQDISSERHQQLHLGPKMGSRRHLAVLKRGARCSVGFLLDAGEDGPEKKLEGLLLWSRPLKGHATVVVSREAPSERYLGTISHPVVWTSSKNV